MKKNFILLNKLAPLNFSNILKSLYFSKVCFPLEFTKTFSKSLLMKSGHKEVCLSKNSMLYSNILSINRREAGVSFLASVISPILINIFDTKLHFCSNSSFVLSPSSSLIRTSTICLSHSMMYSLELYLKRARRMYYKISNICIASSWGITFILITRILIPIMIDSLSNKS